MDFSYSKYYMYSLVNNSRYDIATHTATIYHGMYRLPAVAQRVGFFLCEIMKLKKTNRDLAQQLIRLNAEVSICTCTSTSTNMNNMSVLVLTS